MRHKSYDGARGCYIEAALEVVADKWKGVILYHLLDEPKRFNELKRTFPELSHRILTRQLRELENDGVIFLVNKLLVLAWLLDKHSHFCLK
jgi:DNA-binding HxlR family transcriptional regulator